MRQGSYEVYVKIVISSSDSTYDWYCFRFANLFLISELSPFVITSEAVVNISLLQYQQKPEEEGHSPDNGGWEGTHFRVMREMPRLQIGVSHPTVRWTDVIGSERMHFDS